MPQTSSRTRGAPGRLGAALATSVLLLLAAGVGGQDARGGAAGDLGVSVTNRLEIPRLGETVELRAAALAGRIPAAELPRLVVTDARTRATLPSQAVDEDGDGRYDLVVFQSDFAPGETRAFRLSRGEERKPARAEYRVYGRFVREREDDFAWENDRVAFRAYGPALETFAKEPLTSSAVDAWSKSTTRLVLNDWYLQDDYHVDHGEGGDFYPAGRTRGCGGSGLMIDGRLAVSKNFRESRVLASGPIRLVFELVYPEWEAGVKAVERKRVTLDAGSHFNRFESAYTVASAAPSAPVRWAAGVRKAEGASVRVERARGLLRTWEYQGRYGDGGHLGCAVVMEPSQVVDATEAEGSQLLVASTPAGQRATYYAGSGWDRSGQFPDLEAWERHVEALARRLASPLQVEIAP